MKKHRSKHSAKKAKQKPSKEHVFLKTLFLLALVVLVGSVIFATASVFLRKNTAPPSPPPTSQNTNVRWYTAEQVAVGNRIYQQNCAVCHGANGIGASNWRSPRANGKYPPPPLNGSAHTWHHSLEVLLYNINNGGSLTGGVMPSFEKILTQNEKLAVIAYIQSLWPQDIYLSWHYNVNRQ